MSEFVRQHCILLGAGKSIPKADWQANGLPKKAKCHWPSKGGNFANPHGAPDSKLACETVNPLAKAIVYNWLPGFSGKKQNDSAQRESPKNAREPAEPCQRR
jgi:hypothetical protein